MSSQIFAVLLIFAIKPWQGLDLEFEAGPFEYGWCLQIAAAMEEIISAEKQIKDKTLFICKPTERNNEPTS